MTLFLVRKYHIHDEDLPISDQTEDLYVLGIVEAEGFSQSAERVASIKFDVPVEYLRCDGKREASHGDWVAALKLEEVREIHT